MSTIRSEVFAKAVVALLEEVHVGPCDPKLTWMVSNEPNSGFMAPWREFPPVLHRARARPE